MPDLLRCKYLCSIRAKVQQQAYICSLESNSEGFHKSAMENDGLSKPWRALEADAEPQWVAGGDPRSSAVVQRNSPVGVLLLDH